MASEVPYSKSITRSIQRLIDMDPTPGDSALPLDVVKRGTAAEKANLLADIARHNMNWLRSNSDWRTLFQISEAEAIQNCSVLWIDNTTLADRLQCTASTRAKINFHIHDPIVPSGHMYRIGEMLSSMRLALLLIPNVIAQLERPNPFEIGSWKVIPFDERVDIYAMTRAEAETRWPDVRKDRAPDGTANSRAMTIVHLDVDEGVHLRFITILYVDKLLEDNPSEAALTVRIAVSLAHELGGNVPRLLQGRRVSRREGEIEAFSFGEQFADTMASYSPWSNELREAFIRESNRQHVYGNIWRRSR